MIHTLPPLPYAADALEPKMSQETIDYHYGKHLQTYIDNLNRLIAGTPFEDVPLENMILTASGPLFNNAAQVMNHMFFFNTLSPKRKNIPQELKEHLVRDFGSIETFKEQFKQAAVSLFGSGWVWLVCNDKCELDIVSTQNAGTPLTQGLHPLLTIDVWEHAYYIDYRNARAEGVKAFWEVLDWKVIEERYNKCCKR